MGLEPFLLASSIAGVLGIRLVRKNCPSCSQPCAPDANSIRLLPEAVLAAGKFFRGAGCDHCLGTGYSGRFAITEMLLPDENFREAVMNKTPTHTLHDLAIERGMKTLWQNGLRRVLTGQTTIEEVLRAVALDQV
jgi:general secretion pathway protein E